MAAALRVLLADTQRERREAAFREGRPMSPYVTFPDSPAWSRGSSATPPSLTVDIYGRWLPLEVPGAVDRLGVCLVGAIGRKSTLPVGENP